MTVKKPNDVNILDISKIFRPDESQQLFLNTLGVTNKLHNLTGAGIANVSIFSQAPAIGDAVGDSFDYQEEREYLWKDEADNLPTNKKAFMGRTHEVHNLIGVGIISVQSPGKAPSDARHTAALIEDGFEDEPLHCTDKVKDNEEQARTRNQTAGVNLPNSFHSEEGKETTFAKNKKSTLKDVQSGRFGLDSSSGEKLANSSHPTFGLF